MQILHKLGGKCAVLSKDSAAKFATSFDE